MNDHVLLNISTVTVKWFRKFVFNFNLIGVYTLLNGIIIIIIITITLFKEDNIFDTNASLTYGPKIQRHTCV